MTLTTPSATVRCSVLIGIGLPLISGLAAAQCEIDILHAGDPEPVDVFGWSVDIVGDRAIIGAIGGDEACPAIPNCNSGSAYIFERQGSDWVEVDKITPSDLVTQDEFGQDVAISGDRVLVGAHKQDTGSAYVFLKTGGAWVQEQKLVGADSQTGFHFGHSVAMKGSTALAGSMRDSLQVANGGSAYVFERVGTTWTEIDKLTPGDPAMSAFFGRSVDLQGDVIAVGAHRHPTLGTDSGAAYAFERDDNGTPGDALDDSFAQVTKLVPADGEAGDFFGRSVGVFDETILVGASRDQVAGVESGSAYVFERQPGGWVEIQKLVPSDGADGDRFGVSVFIQGDRAVIGARSQDGGGSNSGAVYVFERTPAGWVETKKIIPSDASAGAALGEEVSIAISGDTALLAAPFASTVGNLAGAAYIYDLAGCLGTTYCFSNPNSTGSVAQMTASGSKVVSANNLVFNVSDLPQNQFGYLVMADSTGFIPLFAGSAGNLCLGLPLIRFSGFILNSGPSGTMQFAPDLANLPQGASIAPGETWYWQLWYRDPPTSNTTDGIEITFL